MAEIWKSQKSMAKTDQIISIPSSPSSSSDISSVGITSSASSSPSPPPTDYTAIQNKTTKSPRNRQNLKDKLKRCKDKTLESELCLTMNRFLSSMLSDDQCRRVIAITIMILAVIGLYHILVIVL